MTGRENGSDATRVPDSFRPALVKLTEDLEASQRQLLRGFESREAVLYWLQDTCVHTLGALPDKVLNEFKRQFQPVNGGNHTLLAALLQPDARSRDVPEGTASELRERFVAMYVRPAHHYALRHLRADAGEYIAGGIEGSAHDPARQRFIAMRPALNELHENQQQALEDLLDGFTHKQELLEWGALVELATHGEIDEAFAARVYREGPTRELLMGQTEQHRRAREAFAARHLLPAYNAGVRDLAGRAQEQPDAEHEETRPTTA